MTTIELFAGIGGFRIAAEECGFQTIWANDICPSACKVYRHRFGAISHHEGDIRDGKGTIPVHDVLTAGFPCQPFSNAGKKRGIRDPRGTLFREIIDVLSQRQPRFFILENVKRLLSMERGLHFATILSSLAELNYHVEWRLLNAIDFGLPQNRQRVFIVGAKANIDSASAGPSKEPVSIRLASTDDLAGQERLGSILSEPSEWQLIERHGTTFPSWGMARCGRFISAELKSFSSASRRIMLRDV
ncbi:MAG TPA: DNA cytosine methyltransferase, partial [Phycisphaerae bacterium]|nr:DNA cytosine methyltransferase [Phycisphaerae bacterium]